MSLGVHWAFFGQIILAILLLALYLRRGAGRGGKSKGMHDCTPAAAAATITTTAPPRTLSDNLTSQAACSRPHLQARSVSPSVSSIGPSLTAPTVSFYKLPTHRRHPSPLELQSEEDRGGDGGGVEGPRIAIPSESVQPSHHLVWGKGAWTMPVENSKRLPAICPHYSQTV